ncbi:DUF3596 domain-containing protein [Geotalea sp. SG265]|uniref:Arm DNA-binding domain-containing protein n=1 Tax=Geotalea sp. SG265 TaxID=2922867 RepID=UPI001FAE91BA|nr:DUF3596 domain-containing protein [Geotalea sp. SG265]
MAKNKVVCDGSKPWHVKPAFGSLYTMKDSRYIYISLNYYKQRLRFPTDKLDTPENWEELCGFLTKVGEKIKRRTFCFAKTFYWLDDATKAHFSALEGHEYHPEPEDVLFGDYAFSWMERKIPTFASVTKQRDYREALNSRVLPHFKGMPFSRITATEVELFIDNLKRSYRNGRKTKPLSVKRVKNILAPMMKIWEAACNDHNWQLRSPFSAVSEKYKELKDRALQEKERLLVVHGLSEETVSSREVFLLAEWQRLLSFVDPHYLPVMELLLLGLIGSELEGLQKQHVAQDALRVRCSVVKDKAGLQYLKFKPKNWFRKREIPMTRRLEKLLDQAMAASHSGMLVEFANDITLPANSFVLTMKDGRPFNYDSFRKTVWDRALKQAGLPARVPYASRHTLVQWSLLIGMTKTRLVDLMGHSTKKMIDEVYGAYRQGLVDEKENILNFLGEDFLALEELKLAFPERYQRKMAVEPRPVMAKAPALAATFGQSFGQSQGLYADNYLK